VVLHVSGNQLGEQLAQPLPMVGVEQPLPHRGHVRRRHTHQRQVVHPEHAVPGEHRRSVRHVPHRQQPSPAFARLPSPAQRRREHVQNDYPGNHPGLASGLSGVPQQCSVTDMQGQSSAQRQPGSDMSSACGEDAKPCDAAGGSDVEYRLVWEPSLLALHVDSLKTHVDQIGHRPSLRHQQCHAARE
jgi:hypothetical protein